MNTAISPARRVAPRPFGDHLRHWRQHRRLSQLDLAQEAEISTRHLSFVETGRSLPSRDMVLRLAERLQVPLRERNALLVAAGYAPMYRERALDDPALAAARQAVDLILRSQEPYPALAVDRHWNMVAGEHMGVAMPFRFRTARGVLNFISTTTVFGTPVDVTLQELALESFFPADTFTSDTLRQLAAAA